jgi:hypothetical protein
MEYLINLFFFGLTIGGFYQIFYYMKEHNRRINKVEDNIFLYDQMYKDILELKNRIYYLEHCNNIKKN